MYPALSSHGDGGGARRAADTAGYLWDRLRGAPADTKCFKQEAAGKRESQPLGM